MGLQKQSSFTAPNAALSQHFPPYSPPAMASPSNSGLRAPTDQFAFLPDLDHFQWLETTTSSIQTPSATMSDSLQDTVP